MIASFFLGLGFPIFSPLYSIVGVLFFQLGVKTKSLIVSAQSVFCSFHPLIIFSDTGIQFVFIFFLLYNSLAKAKFLG